jgi:MFS superfamily sulfate permease-like transporter
MTADLQSLLEKTWALAMRIRLHRPYLPAWDWMRQYKWEYLSGDLNAGLIVSVMLIPQVRSNTTLLTPQWHHGSLVRVACSKRSPVTESCCLGRDEVFLIISAQGMAYAVLAGMPPVYGLFAGIFPNLIYAITGCSRESPMAAIALVSASS